MSAVSFYFPSVTLSFESYEVFEVKVTKTCKRNPFRSLFEPTGDVFYVQKDFEWIITLICLQFGFLWVPLKPLKNCFNPATGPASEGSIFKWIARRLKEQISKWNKWIMSMLRQTQPLSATSVMLLEHRVNFKRLFYCHALTLTTDEKHQLLN